MFTKLLIANRGEIARRINAVARGMGIRTVAVYSDADEGMPFVREADKVYAQTAYATRVKAERVKVMLVSDLADEDVRKMGLVPKKSLQEAIASLDAQKELLCYVIPEGSKTLVF